MKRLTVLLLSMAVIGLLSGCSRPVQTPPGEWFETVTGLALPASASETNADVITVLMVGDTYYFKLATHPEFKAFLETEFKACSRSDAMKYLEPPEDWMEQLDFWNVDEAEQGVFFRLDRSDAAGNRWMNFVSYSEETGVVYLVGVQVAE